MDISQEQAGDILTNGHDMRKVSAHWASRLFAGEHDERCVMTFGASEADSENSKSLFATDDKLWVFHFNPAWEEQWSQSKNVSSEKLNVRVTTRRKVFRNSENK